MVSTNELASIEGFDDDLAKELINRANVHIEKVKKENITLLKAAGMEDYLQKESNIPVEQLLILKENNIVTRDQLANLSSDELIDILNNLDSKNADDIIMESRKHWFKD